MSNNKEIRILFISTDEVQAWKRPIALRFEEREVWVTLYWDEQDGYTALIRTFSDDEWSEEQKTEFGEWLRQQDNLAYLDGETAFEQTNTFLEEDNNE